MLREVTATHCISAKHTEPRIHVCGVQCVVFFKSTWVEECWKKLGDRCNSSYHCNTHCNTLTWADSRWRMLEKTCFLVSRIKSLRYCKDFGRMSVYCTERCVCVYVCVRVRVCVCICVRVCVCVCVCVCHGVCVPWKLTWVGECRREEFSTRDESWFAVRAGFRTIKHARTQNYPIDRGMEQQKDFDDWQFQRVELVVYCCSVLQKWLVDSF